VLLSGGLDSATTLAVARARGHAVFALSFRYGQRHALELDYAARQARRQGVVAHEIMDLPVLGERSARVSSLIQGAELDVPKGREDVGADIPSTYVPARNTVFLAHALAWAETLQAFDVWIGSNALDSSGYPDCRPEYIDAFERVANLGTRMGVEATAGQGIRIHAPLQKLRKHEIIALGIEHGVDYGDTLSCYDPKEEAGEAVACGACDSCQLRRRGFERAGVPDPTRYAVPT
jgi:7-cyano-7-deazaguanine synthase